MSPSVYPKKLTMSFYPAKLSMKNTGRPTEKIAILLDDFRIRKGLIDEEASKK
jgi:hypothetical protein